MKIIFESEQDLYKFITKTCVDCLLDNEYVDCDLSFEDYRHEDIKGQRDHVLKICSKCYEEQGIELKVNSNKWILTSERKPDETGFYLVTIRGAKASTELHYINSLDSWIEYDYENQCFGNEYDVIAWQPLPEPYKGD